MFRKLTNKFKKGLVSLLCVSMLMPNLSVMAASESTDVDFNVKATEVNITVPMNFAVTINPNLPYDNGGFVYADNITVTNDTTCPITLGISNFADEEQTFENDVLPSDVANWDDLSVKETKKYFALGILGSDDTEWMNYNLDSALYAKTIQESTESIDFGEIETKASVNFDLEASYGKAVKEGFTFTYQITWVSELYDGGSDSGSSSTPSDPTNAIVDEAGTTDLEYNTTVTNQVAQANLLDELLGTETVMAAPAEKEIDESKIVGTATISGIKNADATTLYMTANYYEDENGNLYEIVGIEPGSDVEGTFQSNVVETVIIGENLTEIPDYAFNNCTNLVNVEVADTVTRIGQGAFFYCQTLESINIPDSVESIGRTAFYFCTALKSIELPDSITSIDAYAFNYSGIESIKLPSGITAISDGMFENCSSLKSIEIPASVATVGYNAFSGCNSIESIVIDEANEVYDSRENCNAIIETASNKLIFGCKNSTIPSTVKTIASDAFYKCQIESLDIPEGVTAIEGYSFNGCSNLKNVTIPASVETLGDYAFRDCTSLENVTFTEGSKLSSIGNVFSGCTKLTSIELPEGLATINNYAFSYNTTIKSITIPSSVTTIGNNAFSGCNKLITIKYSGPATGSPWGAPNATVVAN